MKLADLGISPEQSSKWQNLAKVPKDKLELALATGMATTTIINKYGAKKPVERLLILRTATPEGCSIATGRLGART